MTLLEIWRWYSLVSSTFLVTYATVGRWVLSDLWSRERLRVQATRKITWRMITWRKITWWNDQTWATVSGSSVYNCTTRGSSLKCGGVLWSVPLTTQDDYDVQSNSNEEEEEQVMYCLQRPLFLVFYRADAVQLLRSVNLTLPEPCKPALFTWKLYNEKAPVKWLSSNWI